MIINPTDEDAPRPIVEEGLKEKLIALLPEHQVWYTAFGA